MAGLVCGCGHYVADHKDGKGRCRQWRRYPEVLEARHCGCIEPWEKKEDRDE